MIRSFVLGALLMCTLLASACDQCGCGPLLGIQPFDRSNNFGLQYRLRYLRGDFTSAGPVSLAKHGDEGLAGRASTDTTRYTELYAALDVRGQYWLGKRLSLFASIPLVNNYSSADHVTQADIYAMGDPQLMARYVVYNTRYSLDTTGTRHRITLGGGVKLPLGQHHAEQFGEELPPDLQPGTGTWDGLLSAEYLMRSGQWGLSVGMFGRYNGTLSSGFRFGHSGSIQSEIFRTVKIGAVQWLPSIGGYAEYAAKDQLDNTVQEGTGGSVLFSHISSRLWWHSYGINITWQHAMAQDLGDSMIPNRERFIVGISYNINKN
ncbi:MAG: hypothetical protein IPP33_04815 [Flavobacteriales bacterium]|nr:hypothetical protein [Flavobacteriales bacterium]